MMKNRQNFSKLSLRSLRKIVLNGIGVVSFLWRVPIASAQETITLPTSHWAYEYLQELGLRRRLPGTMLFTLPLRYQQIATVVDSLGPDPSSAAERFWLQRLKTLAATSEAAYPKLLAGGRVLENAGNILDTDRRSRLAVRSHLGIFPDRHLALYNVINLDQNLGDDPNYIGKRWRGFTGFTEQAYALLHFDKYLVKFGRDFIRWGRARDATLLISDYARPIDHLLAQFDFSRARFTYVAAKLDRRPLADSSIARYGVDYAERYLTAVRAEAEVSKNRLQFAFTQFVVSGGPSRVFEWNYLNPFLIYHGEQLNDKQQGGNIFVALDFMARPKTGLEFYGQLLIDDIQVEKRGRGDLEPNETGYLLGVEKAVNAATVGLEYTRVANRTYNTVREWEKFLHRRRPLAHFLGNDFDRWLLHTNLYAGKQVQFYLTTELLRHGEGRIDSTFDRPWENATLEKGYREKFPFGVVERSWQFRLEARWHPRPGFFLAAHGQFARYKNFANISGRQENAAGVFVRLWWEKDWLIPIRQ
jgi:hypothetical protein